MNEKKINHICIAFLIAVFVFSCATGKKEYDIGKQLSTAGKYKEAIAYFEQAIAKEPGNKEYEAALAGIKANLINSYVQQAKRALTNREPLTMGAVNIAKDKLAQAMGIEPGSLEVKKLSAFIEKEQNSLISTVNTLYSEAKQYMEAKQWLKAYFNLQQIQDRFPNYEDSYQLLRQIRDTGSDDFYEKALVLFETEDFKGARNYLEKTLSLKPDHKLARALVKTVNQQDNKEYFIEKARESVLALKWDGAVAAYERALEYDPDNQDLRQLITHVRAKAGEFYIRKARNQTDQGWLMKAFNNFDLADKYIKDNADFQLNSLRKDLATRAGFTAEQFKEQGLYGSAWYWYGKIKKIDPEYPKIFFLTQGVEDNIRQRVQKSIAVFDFSSPSNSEDAGVIVANNLITYLFNTASGDIKILERENLKSILEEMKLGQIGVVSGDTAKQMGQVYGIDVAIMGSVLLYNVDSTVSEGTKSVRYKIGTKIEDNIEYLNWIAKNPHPTPEQLVNAPAAKVKIPEYTEKEYKVSKYKKVGFVQLSFRIVDISTGENIRVKTIESKEIAEDETSSGLPDAGINFDPLEISTDTELLQKMTSKVVSDLGREALRPLQNLEKNYFQKGTKFLRRRNNLKAAENFINAVFDEKMKRIQGSPMTKKALENLDEIFYNYKVQISS